MLVVMYVTLALLGQIAIRIAIVYTDRLPSFIGWVTIAWNVSG